jgi:hypothetical protein
MNIRLRGTNTLTETQGHFGEKCCTASRTLWIDFQHPAVAPQDMETEAVSARMRIGLRNELEYRFMPRRIRAAEGAFYTPPGA